MAFPRSPLSGIRPLDGTYEGNRGAQADLSPRQVQALLKLENGSVAGESLGIALSIATLGKLTAADLTRSTSIIALPRARIMWGAGNSRTFVDVDFTSGAALGVVAETLSIEARYDVCKAPWSEEDECDVSCLPRYHVEATVGYGSYCCTSTFTEIAFVESSSERTRVQIPPFARSFTVLPIADAAVTAHLVGYSDAFTVKNVIVAPLTNLNQENNIRQLPIPNGMRWVEIENTGEAPAAAFVMFGLGV